VERLGVEGGFEESFFSLIEETFRLHCIPLAVILLGEALSMPFVF
jgi:hypothetical protein